MDLTKIMASLQKVVKIQIIYKLIEEIKTVEKII